MLSTPSDSEDEFDPPFNLAQQSLTVPASPTVQQRRQARRVKEAVREVEPFCGERSRCVPAPVQEPVLIRRAAGISVRPEAVSVLQPIPVYQEQGAVFHQHDGLSWLDEPAKGEARAKEKQFLQPKVNVMGSTALVGTAGVNGQGAGLQWFTGLEVLYEKAIVPGKRWMWTSTSAQFDPLGVNRNYISPRAWYHYEQQMGLNVRRNDFIDGNAGETFLFRLATADGPHVSCQVWLWQHAGEADFLIGDADTKEEIAALMERSQRGDRAAREASKRDEYEPDSRKRAPTSPPDSEPAQRRLGQGDNTQREGSRAGERLNFASKVECLDRNVLRIAFDGDGAVFEPVFVSIRKVAFGSSRHTYISPAFLAKILRAASCVVLENDLSKIPCAEVTIELKSAKSLNYDGMTVRVDHQRGHTIGNLCDIVLGTDCSKRYREVVNWAQGTKENVQQVSPRGGNRSEKQGKSASKGVSRSGRQNGTGPRPGGGAGNSGAGGGGSGGSDDDADPSDGGDGDEGQDEPVYDLSGDESLSEVREELEKVQRKPQSVKQEKVAVSTCVVGNRLEEVLVYAPTTSPSDKASYERGIRVAVRPDMNVPLVRQGFTSERKLSRLADIWKCPKEGGMCDSQMSDLLLRRIVEHVVPELDAGEDLTPAEGKLAAQLFRRSLPSEFISAFNNADSQRLFSIGVPGDWNRIVGWYMNKYNNSGSENAQITKALACVQRPEESAQDWADRMDSIVQSVSEASKDQRVAVNLAELLRVGWLQGHMSVISGKAEQRVNQPLTYREFMTELKAMAVQDPEWKAKLRHGAGQVTQPQTKTQREPRDRFRNKRTPAERAAFAQVRAVEVRENGGKGGEGGIVCRLCHMTGHKAFECKDRKDRKAPAATTTPAAAPAAQPKVDKKAAAGDTREARRCYVCGEEGHEARNCSKQKGGARDARPPR